MCRIPAEERSSEGESASGGKVVGEKFDNFSAVIWIISDIKRNFVYYLIYG